MTQEGDASGYITLGQARVLAIQHVRDNRDLYGRRFARRELVWEVLSQEESAEYYDIRLAFRPAGRFRGEPGVVQLSIDKAGNIQLFQTPDEPSDLGWQAGRRPWWLVPAAFVGIVAVVIIIVVAIPRTKGGGTESGIRPAAIHSTTARPEPAAALQQEAAVAPAATLPLAAAEALPATPVPTPVRTATPQAATRVRPFGTLNVGLLNLGTYAGHPGMAANRQIFLNSAFGITESLLMHNTTDGAVEPMLADWSISSDFRRWSFKLREGVQFHKGFGELTSRDVRYSFEQAVNSDRHPRAAFFRDLLLGQNISLEIVDDYTVIWANSNAIPNITVLDVLASPHPALIWIISQQQSKELGTERANNETAATGPWEILESSPSEFWWLRAVEDHWRKTPEFAEMFLWDIPEEATRLAAFQVGQLDTFQMSLNTWPVVSSNQEVEIMRLPNTGQAGLNFYGQSYVGIGTPDQRPGYDPDLPWVSSDPDINSVAWGLARKVRQALSIAIDRELIADKLLQGFGGRPLAMRDWAGREQRLPPGMRWDYDPQLAKELLAEAGYPDGFAITLSPAQRGAPAELEACEAVAAMWQDIGLIVDFQAVPYGTLRPSLIDRTYQGATCHSVPTRMAPALTFGAYLTRTGFNFGVEHPILEEVLPKAMGAISRQEREEYELEIVHFFYENALAGIGLYSYDGLWPLGPKVGPWPDHIRRGDLRLINSLEWAPHRN